MRKTYLLMLLFSGWAAAVEGDEQESIQKTFSGVRELIVDNVFGSIEVTGRAGGEVHFTARRGLRADSPEKAAEARRDVQLEITERNGTLRLYVNGPFRDRHGSFGRTGYRVTYDFSLQVPASASLWLRTVNNGEILVKDTSGDYDIDNVNGGVEMREIAGSGRAHALNGAVRVLYRENPRAACFFGSLNGEVRVSFRPGLSADLRFKTFNGGVFTDFPVTYLPAQIPVAERRNGKFVYKSDRSYGVRVGNGGPELKFDSFNGNIEVLNRGRQ